MNRRTPHNVSASVHQRLLNIVRETARPFDKVLQYFAMERLMYRLSQTKHADSFVLKGALLFRIWATPDSRATRDIDLLAYLDNSPDDLANIVRDVCTVGIADSGLLSTGPASSRQTLTLGSSLSRLASTQPAEPAPTMM